MKTVSLVTITLLVVSANSSPLMDLHRSDPAAVKRDPVPSYGYNDQAPWRTEWRKKMQKQSAPQQNSIAEETKIPAWVNPWTSLPVEHQSPPVKRKLSGVRNYFRIPYVAHRFRVYKDEKDDLKDKMEKRAYNSAQWFRFNQDVDMKRAPDLIRGLNSVPMMGKRMYQDLCQECQ
eukprot:GFUD01136484.1.p1 GENE.GFUD01136484.1~~GFUD01136484.1.p1  ORF type:complete len:175 (-),score=50.88 GFUD01136484.1:39-563(-)